MSSKTIAVWSICGVLGFAAACSSNKTTEQAVETKAPGQNSSSPAGTDAKKVDRALVRFINATAEPENLYFGDTALFQNIAYKKVTRYMEVSAERHEFKLMAPGQPATGTALATDSEAPGAGKHYTVVASANKNGKAELTTVDDNLVTPTAGQAKIRVINTVPGLDVDVYVPGKNTAFISGAGYNHATDYKEINPATTELMVRHGMSKKGEVPLKDVTLQAGKLYTLIVESGVRNKMTAQTIEDELAGPAAGSQAP